MFGVWLRMGTSSLLSMLAEYCGLKRDCDSLLTRLKTLNGERSTGRIRLSEDDGLSARSFVAEDDDSEDDDGDNTDDDLDDEPLSTRRERLQRRGRPDDSPSVTSRAARTADD